MGINFDDLAVTITFGKYRGFTIDEVDTGYLRWMVATAHPGGDSALDRFVDENGSEIESVLRAEIRTALAEVPAYELNGSQQLAADGLVSWLDAPAPHAKLEGGAGYGKSFTVLDVAKRAIEAGWKVNACATSYVATQVLSKQLGVLPGVEVRTIASMLRLEKVYDQDRTGYVPSERTQPRLRDLLQRKHLLIVDEYSMVGRPIDKLLLDAASQWGGKLLAVGDLSQLPPVGQSDPSAMAAIETSATLTEPMRYPADSDLFRLEQMARSEPEAISNPLLWANSTQVHTHHSSASLFDAFIKASRENPNDDNRIVSFRRNVVAKTNAEVRENLFGAEAAKSPVVEDERLMVLGTTDVRLYARDYDGSFVPVQGEEGEARWYSGTTFRVEEVAQSTIRGIPCHMVRFLDTDYWVPTMFAVTENKMDMHKLGGAEFNQRMTEVRAEAQETGFWGDFHQLKNSFIPVGYNYAMTVHRCQGQTVDRVFFAPDTLTYVPGMGRALVYVAATRAKKEAHMVVGGSVNEEAA